MGTPAGSSPGSNVGGPPPRIAVISYIDDVRHVCYGGPRNQTCQDRHDIRGACMRVSRERAAQNRQRILSAATRLFRERGISATGVDAITAVAGLTHGAVYSQFGSKEAIAAEAMREAFAGSRRRWRRLLERSGPEKALFAIV